MASHWVTFVLLVYTFLGRRRGVHDLDHEVGMGISSHDSQQ